MNSNLGLIGKKLGCTQIFDANGNVARVTVIEAGPCLVVRKRTVEQGNFMVLTSPDIPSVLVETGFLTNKRDAKLLTNDRFQRMVAVEIADGVENYRDQVELGLVASNRRPGSVAR